MTPFLIICALLLVVALLFIVWPLWRNAARGHSVVRDAANLEIARDQVAEMDADLRNGLLTPEMYEQGKRELQARLLDEVHETETAAPQSRPHKTLTIALAVLLPLLTIAVYWGVGKLSRGCPPNDLCSVTGPEYWKLANNPSARFAGGDGMQQQQQANNPKIAELEAKAQKNPEDIESLHDLARAYAEAGQYNQSAGVYNKLTQAATQGPKEMQAQLWAEFADVLGMASGKVLAGHPTMLIKRALELDPNNLMANELAASAAMERHDYAVAVKYWEKSASMIPQGDDDAKPVADALQEARAGLARGDKPITVQPGMGPAAADGGDAGAGGGMPQMMAGGTGGGDEGGAGGQPVVSSGKERITGTVTLSDALKSKVSPGDTLFVLARATSGPPMPLAVMRASASQLPLQFSLDDTMSPLAAMSPQMRLSKFDSVVVIARISKSGQPMSSPGDLETVSQPMKPGASGLKLVIDTVVK